MDRTLKALGSRVPPRISVALSAPTLDNVPTTNYQRTAVLCFLFHVLDVLDVCLMCFIELDAFTRQAEISCPTGESKTRLLLQRLRCASCLFREWVGMGDSGSCEILKFLSV